MRLLNSFLRTRQKGEVIYWSMLHVAGFVFYLPSNIENDFLNYTIMVILENQEIPYA